MQWARSPSSACGLTVCAEECTKYTCINFVKLDWRSDYGKVQRVTLVLWTAHWPCHACPSRKCYHARDSKHSHHQHDLRSSVQVASQSSSSSIHQLTDRQLHAGGSEGTNMEASGEWLKRTPGSRSQPLPPRLSSQERMHALLSPVPDHPTCTYWAAWTLLQTEEKMLHHKGKRGANPYIHTNNYTHIHPKHLFPWQQLNKTRSFPNVPCISDTHRFISFAATN